MEEIMNMLKEKNPELASYMEMIQSMNSTEETNVEIEAHSNLKEITGEIENLKSINKRLFQIIESLNNNLEKEVKLNDTLAYALGACENCFGTQSNCKQCNGHGVPGYFLPDMISFQQLIVPAITRYNQKLKINQSKTFFINN